MDKIKAFLTNKVTKIVTWVLWGLATVVLLLGGVGVADLSKGVGLVAAIITAVTVLITFIIGKIENK